MQVHASFRRAPFPPMWVRAAESGPEVVVPAAPGEASYRMTTVSVDVPAEGSPCTAARTGSSSANRRRGQRSRSRSTALLPWGIPPCIPAPRGTAELSTCGSCPTSSPEP